MNESGLLFIGSIGFFLTWTVTVAGMANWLAKKFRDVEKQIYREQDKTRQELTRRLEGIHTRVYRLELKAFGFTSADLDQPSSISAPSAYQKPQD